MEITSGHKMVLSKATGKAKLEISRHKDPVMDNILVINSISGGKTYKNTWITQKEDTLKQK